MRLQSLSLLFVLVAVASCKVSYDGYQVWRINVDSESHVREMRKLVQKFNLDILSERRGSVDVNVEPKLIPVLSVHLAKRRMQWEKIIADLGSVIRAEEERLAIKPAAFDLTEYNTLEDIESYLTDLSETNDFATLRSIGQSVEGRDILQLEISVGGGGTKPVVWMDFNIHAREWITNAVALYGIDYLLNGYGTDGDVTALLDAYDVLIIPVVNPDGYSYTWTDDRLWRKNRNKYPTDNCYGIDLNRNFDNHWAGEGTSNRSCTETYDGPGPASEPETQAIQDGINELIASRSFNILFSTHSYSQLWMYPYGWSATLPADADEMNRVAGIGVNALKDVHNTQYEYGPIAITIYPAAGNTVDYAYAHGVVYSYTLELRDTGTFGFELPAREITPTGEETWAGFIAAILAV